MKRPESFENFAGQDHVINNLKLAVKAAINRDKAVDHILLYGPPGLGKTSIAMILAKEMGVDLVTTSGPILTKPGDLAAIITKLPAKSVLFIDEIHRMNRATEESLYLAMEDFALDLLVGEGTSARSVRLALPAFTVIGATTKLGSIAAPLRDRFGIQLRMEPYDNNSLISIIMDNVEEISITKDAASIIAQRSRGTPRIAKRLLRRVIDYAHSLAIQSIDQEDTQDALNTVGTTKHGLDKTDMLYIRALCVVFNGGPVGVETISAAINEDHQTIEDVIEPYLLQQGFIERTKKGRIITVRGKKVFDDLSALRN